MHSAPRDAARPSVPWDLDALDGDALRRAYTDVEAFVVWLRRCDITVPSCWYTHGWVVRRLAALGAWQDDAYCDGATGRDAADWWRTGLMPLCSDWRELIAHRGEHTSPDNPLDDPAPVPSLDQVVAELLAERAE
jgi:hypothetical protein